MKKTMIMAALMIVSVVAMGQSMKVQSAYSDMKNDRLKNAKENIDEACQNEKTMNDAKTWCYAGLIYAQIVDASFNNQKLFKKQKIEVPVDEMTQTGISALKKSIEIEKKENTHEYTQTCMETMKNLCGYEGVFAANAYNEGKYEEASKLFHKAVEDAKMCNHTDFMLASMYNEADCYRMLKQPEKRLELYRELAKLNTDKADVYLTIYADNYKNGDTTKAINALKKGVRMTAKDTANNITMKATLAGAYYWAKQTAEGDKILDELLKDGGNNTATLNRVANVYSDQGNADKATELYNKSLSIDPNQFDAFRGLGLVYYNKAADGYEQAGNIPMDQQEAYDKKIKEANDYFAQCVPHFQNALKIKNSDFTSLKALKTAYSKLASRQDIDQSKRDEYKAAYQDVSLKLQKLAQ